MQGAGLQHPETLMGKLLLAPTLLEGSEETMYKDHRMKLTLLACCSVLLELHPLELEQGNLD